MTKRQKSKLPVTSDIVFDESDSFSSDEDDNLQSFRTAMKKRRISNKRESESEARSSLSEEESESENSDSDHNDDLAKGKLDKLKETLNQVPVQEKNDSSSDDNGESEVESSEEEIESEKASSASDEDEENDKAKKQEKPSVEKEVDANERVKIMIIDPRGQPTVKAGSDHYLCWLSVLSSVRTSPVFKISQNKTIWKLSCIL